MNEKGFLQITIMSHIFVLLFYVFVFSWQNYVSQRYLHVARFYAHL